MKTVTRASARGGGVAGEQAGGGGGGGGGECGGGGGGGGVDGDEGVFVVLHVHVANLERSSLTFGAVTRRIGPKIFDALRTAYIYVAIYICSEIGRTRGEIANGGPNISRRNIFSAQTCILRG